MASSEGSPLRPTSSSDVGLWILLGVVGRYIRVVVTVQHEVAVVSAPDDRDGATGSAPPPLPAVTVGEVAAFLQMALQAEGEAARLRRKSGKHSEPHGNAQAPSTAASTTADSRVADEVVDVDVPVVQLDFFDSATKQFAEPDVVIREGGRHLLLFCEPTQAEYTLATLFASAPRPTLEPSPVGEAGIHVCNNLLTAVQAVKRVADRTLTRCQDLSRSVDADLADAQAKVAALREYREALTSDATGTSGVNGTQAKGKDTGAKRLKAGIKVATEALDKARELRAAAHDILRSQESLLTLISLDVGSPCEGDDHQGASDEPERLGEKEVYLRACLTSALLVLRGCLADAQHVAELLEGSSTAIGMVGMVYERFEDAERRPAAVARAQSLLRRREALQCAVRAVLAPLEEMRRNLECEREGFISSGEFALLPEEQRQRLRQPLSLTAKEENTQDDGEDLVTPVLADDVESLLSACGLHLDHGSEAL